MGLEPDTHAAARALIDWWGAAGVDLDDARAIVRAAPRPAVAQTQGGAEATARTGAADQQKARAKSAPRPVPAAAGVDDARAAAQGAASLTELRAAIEAFNGCGLKATARSTVFGDGVETAQILLIGEGPGREEDEQGRPFVGRSGQLLDRMLATIGLSRQTNLFISNVVFWRPPGNRPATQGELAACLPFVDRLIALMAPKLVILAGGVAAQTVLRRSEGVTKLRGRRLHHASAELTNPINTMVMLHPAYLLRQPQQKRLAWADLLALEAWAEELGAPRDPRL